MAKGDKCLMYVNAYHELIVRDNRIVGVYNCKFAWIKRADYDYINPTSRTDLPDLNCDKQLYYKVEERVFK